MNFAARPAFFPQRTSSTRQESNFSTDEQARGAYGERARSLAEAKRVKAAVESVMSLLQVMEQPSLEGPGGVEYSLPFVLDARGRRAVVGDVKSISMHGSTYGWSVDSEGCQTFTLSNNQAHKAVRWSADGSMTYIEEHKAAARPPAVARALTFA